MQSLQVNNPKLLSELQGFLQSNHLPYSDVQLVNSCYLLYYHNSELVGSIGLKWYQSHALLRSVAVTEKWRGKGLGKTMVLEILNEAKKANKVGVFLLTETAAPFFKNLGFVEYDRKKTPLAIQSSNQFSQICPTSAHLLFTSFI